MYMRLFTKILLILNLLYKIEKIVCLIENIIFLPTDELICLVLDLYFS